MHPLFFRKSKFSLSKTALFLTFFCSLNWADTKAFSFTTRMGLALVEEGDDRQRAGLSVHGELGDYGARVYYYGRTFGPVTERTIAVSLLQKENVFSSKAWSISYGLAGISESTILNFTEEADQAFNANESSENLGVHFGVGWEMQSKSNLSVGAFWDSLLFPAGAAGILLATGRKQFLQLVVGYSI